MSKHEDTNRIQINDGIFIFEILLFILSSSIKNKEFLNLAFLCLIQHGIRLYNKKS